MYKWGVTHTNLPQPSASGDEPPWLKFNQLNPNAMDAIFSNLRTIEQEKAKFGFSKITIARKRTGHNGNYTYYKHREQDPVTKQWTVESDVYIRMGASEDGQHYYAVSKDLSKDIQVNKAPNPDRIVIIQDVEQEPGKPVPTLMYAPDRESEFEF